MARRNRIALFTGQAEETYQSEFISGFLKESFAADYDVCIFSMYRKYQDTPEREKGESNIFSLMQPEEFDGAVILKDSIQTENAAQKLEEQLQLRFSRPILVIEKESELFPSICTDCYAAEYDLISHLIEVHGCRRILFVCGKKWHKHSKERLRAYRDAMQNHGLPVSEDDVMIGDFWYQSGEQCAEQILSRQEPLPDAVACANDQMALGVCKALAAHGVRVPEDIAVIGYDSTFEGQTSPRSLTSALIPAKEFGEYAFRFLCSSMEGKTPDAFRLKPRMVCGESCGCPGTDMPGHQIRRKTWGTDISEDGYASVFNMMDETLLVQPSLQDFLNTVYSYVYQLRGIREFHLCLGSDWQHMESGCHLPNDGYPSRMLHAIRYYGDHRNNMARIDAQFPSAEMLPELHRQQETPCAYFFTPVFFENECFGYAVVSYGSCPRSYDEIYRRWIGSVCRGFEMLRRNLLLKQMQEHLERIQNSKFAIAEHSYEALEPQEQQEYQLVTRILDKNLLDYHFQPIVRVADGEIFAYEALMRSRTEQRISPLSMIRYAAMQGRLSDVERATFLNVLEILRTHEAEFGEARIFINSIPGVSISDADSVQLQEYFRIYASRVVVELTEEAELKDDDLNRLKAYFDRMHIDIAIDDYGTGYSNVSNLLRYMPNYVKIDRSLLSGIQNHLQKQHFVREIIDFCHDNNIMALAEGVETAEELQAVIHLGADLIQGYYTARPSSAIVGRISDSVRSEILRFHQERVDGHNRKLYIAGKTNRISLSKLQKDGCTDIVIGQEGMVYKDISLIGAPQMKTGIHMRIEAGYSGRITLEDASFSNIKNRPCIELGEHTDVTLVLVGFNSLYDGGILVPESARLIIEGDGTLELNLNAPESYGIGNTHQARHGELVFEQDGPVNFNSRGKKGICIGSGAGGVIRINRGEFNFNINTETCVGIGALSGDVKLELKCCHIEADFSVTYGVLIGSLEGNATVSVRNSAVNHFGAGKYFSGIGTLHGKTAEVTLADAGISVNLRSDYATCIGALYGSSALQIENVTLKLTTSGQRALVFGGYDPHTTVRIVNSDTHANINSTLGKDTFAPPENFETIDGRQIILINGEEAVHPQSSNYILP